MAAALVGSVGLQAYWIISAIRLNETNFDNNVFAALNKVKRSIEENERNEIASKHLSRQRSADHIDKYSELPSIYSNSYRQSEIQYDIDLINIELNLKELSERLNPKEISSYMKAELENRGIHIKYDLGVYSNKSKGFVIFNDHFQVEEFNTNFISTGETQSLYNTNYKVKLFERSDPASNLVSSPGLLMIYFPNKIGLLWSNVWLIMIASLVFTLLILFCFSYVIVVIFRQKKVSEMKTDFINNMTHEFKTPIATISLATDSINSPVVVSDPDKVKRFTAIIKQENKRMLNQVEKVLQIAMIDKNDFNLNITEIDLNQVIDIAVDHSALQVEKKGGTIIKNFESEEPIIEGDLIHVTNIIYNLLDNAIKYSKSIPHIEVVTKNTPGGVEVTVKDEGIGMTKEQTKYIFDKFYRVHTGNVHNVKGFGLGLSYVKAMMTAHKGSVSVESELGKGSTFVLHFPLKQ